MTLCPSKRSSTIFNEEGQRDRVSGQNFLENFLEQTIEIRKMPF